VKLPRIIGAPSYFNLLVHYTISLEGHVKICPNRIFNIITERAWKVFLNSFYKCVTKGLSFHRVRGNTDLQCNAVIMLNVNQRSL